jgi:hypothetical protein
MSLLAIHSDFENDLIEPFRVYEELATVKTFNSATDFTLDELCLLEGVLSHVWQAWCRFCRRIIMESCQGTQNCSGVAIPAVALAHSDSAVSGAAVSIKRKRKNIWGAPNSVLRDEPTWGDVDVLLDIIVGLSPANSVVLTGMCTMAASSAKILQAARNAAAHHNFQTVASLIKLSGPYSVFSISHPCQAMFWLDTLSGNYLLTEAIEGLKDAATFAVL